MSKIIFPFKKKSDAEVAKTANHILSSLKGNALFPDATLVTQLEKDLNDFQASLNAAADGGRTLASVKRDKRAVLMNTLTRLAFYVSQVSNGDRSMLLSTGFDLAKERGASSPMATIETLVVNTTKPGEASIAVNTVSGARAYIHEYTTEEPTATTVWTNATTATTAHRKHTFTGLESLVVHWFRVTAIGLYGQSVISDPVARVVQ